jgi:hypothetical protein
MRLSDGIGVVEKLGNSDSSAGMVSSLVQTGVGFIPGVGPLLSGFAGSVAGSITKFIGGNPRKRFSAEASAAAPHRPGASPTSLYDQNFNEEDGNDFARWAIQNGVTVEDIGDSISVDIRATGHSWLDVVSWYRSHPETIKANLAQLFRENPELRSSAAALVPTSAAPLTPYQPQPLPLPTSQLYANSLVAGTSAFTGGGSGLTYTLAPASANAAAAAAPPLTIKDLLNAAMIGAKDGVTGKVMDTPAGRAAQDKGAIEFFKNRWYIPLALFGLISGLCVALFMKRK